jgi:hypothetical protein
MTASELIRKLNDLPPETKIVVRGYENGYNDIITLRKLTITVNKENKWWDGEYRQLFERIAVIDKNRKPGYEEGFIEFSSLRLLKYSTISFLVIFDSSLLNLSLCNLMNFTESKVF